MGIQNDIANFLGVDKGLVSIDREDPLGGGTVMLRATVHNDEGFPIATNEAPVPVDDWGRYDRDALYVFLLTMKDKFK